MYVCVAGHFLLTNLLMDLLVASKPSRVVTVSSIAHKKGEINFEDINLEKDYGGYSAYMRSKLANVLFSNELGRRLQGMRSCSLLIKINKNACNKCLITVH